MTGKEGKVVEREHGSHKQHQKEKHDTENQHQKGKHEKDERISEREGRGERDERNGIGRFIFLETPPPKKKITFHFS